MTAETAEFTSGDIAAAAKETAPVVASPAITPSETAAKTPADATSQPAKPEVKTDEHGPLPFERHHAILSSTREEYEGRLARTAWAERYDPKAVQKAMDLAARYEAEQAERAKKTPDVPQADLRTEDGTKMFSEAQNMAAIEYAVNKAVGALREEFGGRITPFETAHQEQERINGHVSEIQEALTWRGFNEHMPIVTKAIADANAKGQPLSVRDAYILHVVPLVADASAEALAAAKVKWAEELNDTTKKTTNDINPTRTPASSRKKDSDMSISELFADETAKRKAS